MAWLSVLGPLVDVVGAHVALGRAEQSRWVSTGDPQVDAVRAADDRGRGAWMADTALALVAGRAMPDGQSIPQPVEVALVMTPDQLLDAAGGSVEVPGHGTIPASDAQHRVDDLVDHGDTWQRRAGLWLRRLFTSPDGRDLVAMDSRRRLYTGVLRQLLQLRDPTCRVPWCDAPTRHIDHVDPAARGGPTSAGNAMGACARHNDVKDQPGWLCEVLPGDGPHAVRITTPTAQQVTATAPPPRGHGSGPPARAAPAAPAEDIPASPLEAELGRLVAAA